MGIGGDHRETVTGGDEEVTPQDHVAVAIPVGGGCKIHPVGSRGQFDDLMGMHQVGIRMAATEILLGDAVDHGARFRPEDTLQDMFGVGTGDRVHGIEAHVEHTGIEQLMNPFEVEQFVHQLRIVFDRIDDVDPGVAERHLPMRSRSMSAASRL